VNKTAGYLLFDTNVCSSHVLWLIALSCHPVVNSNPKIYSQRLRSCARC